MSNVIASTYNSFKNSPTTAAMKQDLFTTGSESLRIFNATSVAAMRSTALTMRATSITVESVNAGLGYALEHTPKTYEETKEGISSVMDNIMAMFDEEEEEKTTVQTTV